jgi:antitoxin ParD1/3/4
MRTTQQLSITLPNDMADLVKTKVAEGEYASESEVVREGLRSLMARDKAIEHWLRDSIGSIYDAMKADPARGISSQELKKRLAKEHQQSNEDNAHDHLLTGSR